MSDRGWLFLRSSGNLGTAEVTFYPVFVPRNVLQHGGGNHLLAVGNYFTEPRVLKVLREDILLGNGDFRRILDGLAPGLLLDTSESLKKVPKGFPEEGPDSEFFKLKNFCLVESLDDDFILSPNLADDVLAVFKTGKPFLDYVNRAIDYCREERNEYFTSLDF